MSFQSIVILTGAGISAESGLLTFRDNGGLWCNHRIEDVATPEAFARDPALVQQFYNMRRAQLCEVEPNAAHLALAQFALDWPGPVLLVTQNVDNLHERAEAAVKNSAENKGKTNVFHRLIHMHGELTKARCTQSDRIFDWDQPIASSTPCPCCNRSGRLRPHIVWFGEMPLEMGLIEQSLADCDLFLSIGTSGNVYPAAGFVQQARYEGHAHCVELNLEPSLGRNEFHEAHYGPASQIVPEYLSTLK